jgi:hypothetical protein
VRLLAQPGHRREKSLSPTEIKIKFGGVHTTQRRFALQHLALLDGNR